MAIEKSIGGACSENQRVEGAWEEEAAFEDAFCPPLPIAPLANVTNLVAVQEARKERKRADVALTGAGVRRYAALKAAAEEYAVLKKQELSEADAEAALWALYHRTRRAVFTPGASQSKAGSATAALQELVLPFVPVPVDGVPLSVGSIPHAAGEACGPGPCRFHRKGKCFDGVLCRFCHCTDSDHAKPRPAKAAPKRTAKPKRKPAPPDVAALHALFAALDTPTRDRHGLPRLQRGQLPSVPEVCTWPLRT